MTSIELYSKLSRNYTKQITHSYSTSFSIGIRLFDKRCRQPIYALYGFVRMADEIVDSFHVYDKSKLLEEFREDTKNAIASGISLNPVLQSFQLMVNEYQIPMELIDAFLDSMEMDLTKTRFSKEEYDKYIYGSAEVIGLICLKIFVQADQNKYEQLKSYARSLGSAFQKVNFLRDFNSDYRERNRIYFPGVEFNHFKNHHKKEIEAEIEREFSDAWIGVKQLPKSVRLGVSVAYWYYHKLFLKIKRSDASDILLRRLRISDLRKLIILLNCSIRYHLRWIGFILILSSTC